ncbi:hypothetical protein BKI52_41590 [marine bacterium AO1-C]|nr:hypothetical protein BKI52_41590 [marine bacterium AO1-C]
MTIHQKLQSEANLIAEAQQDPAKFKVLYERHFDEIFAFVYKKVQQREPSGDITSQVFLKALLKINTFQFRNIPFTAWLYVIARNEVNMYYRNHKRLKEVNLDEAWVHQLATEFGVDHEDWEAQEARLLAALEKLKPKELLVLRLRFYENCSFKEVGQKIGITENNAKVRTYRVLAKLKKILTK